MLSENGRKFEICVRAVILKNNKILVCWHKNKNYYFFPGGHIEFGERAEDALSRELKEELEILIEKLNFIGVVENIYKENGKPHHEINLVFEVKAKNVKDKSKEDHLDFFFLDFQSFVKKEVLPLALKEAIIKWRKDKKIFWASQFYKETFL